MKKRKTPQEKKALSYEKDRRNAYGENDKASRKAIRFNKKYVNKSYRKEINNKLKTQMQEFYEEDADSIEFDLLNVQKKHWVKYSDISLQDYIARQQQRRKKD
ncbi:MAG: hypothetical protein GY810_31785 [Aureispira sp.]|nr:hypothetical protein [Aureispira sp.]